MAPRFAKALRGGESATQAGRGPDQGVRHLPSSIPSPKGFGSYKGKKPHSSGGALTRRQSGIALLITLSILALLVFMLLALLTTARIERQLSRFSSDGIRARLAAQAAANHALNVLTVATTNDNYVTFVDNPSWQTPANQRPVLYITNLTLALPETNVVSGFTTESTDFNAKQQISTNIYLTSPFNFQWIYLVDNTVTPAITNARYAFWCDDESMKANLLAGGISTGMFSATELEMNIAPLPGIDTARAGTIIGDRANGFETLDAIREMDSGMTRAEFNGAKFHSTIFSRDSSTNYLELSGGTNAFKVDINSLTNLSIVDIAVVLSNACPAVATKYAGSTNWLQFAANLKSYLNPDRQPAFTNLGGTYIIGRGSNPLINEVAFSNTLTYAGNGACVDPNFWTNYFAVTNFVTVELFNIYSTNYTPRAGEKIVVVNPANALVISNFNAAAGPSQDASGLASFEIPITATIPAYSYYCVTLTNALAGTFGFSTNFGGLINPVLTRETCSSPPTYIIYTNNFGLIDFANISHDSQSVTIPVTAGTPPAAGAGDSMMTNKVVKAPGDPRVNYSASIWEYQPPTHGTANPTFTPNTGPDADTLATLNADKGYFVRCGPMQSIAEIGQIPVGYCGSATVNDMFRTLKLYGDGNVAGANSEDYQLLDALMATNSPQRSRVNINAAREDYANSKGVLTALLGGATIPLNANPGVADFKTLLSIGATIPRDAAKSIIDAGAAGGVNPPYRSIADLLKATGGIATNASPADQTTKWRREGPLRSVANALTTRGKQFSIYGIGQALQITPRSTNVLSEAYIQMVVERVPVPGSPPPTNIYYRPLYIRYLAP